MSDNVPTKEELDEVANAFFREVSERRGNQNPTAPTAPKIEVSFVNSDQIEPFIKTPPKDKFKTVVIQQ